MTIPAVACVSSTDIQSLETQLRDLNLQILQLQKQGPSKSEVADLETSITEEIRILRRLEADMQVELRAISAQIEQLKTKLEDTNFRLAQLSQQIAATNQELRVFRDTAELRAAAPQRPPTPSSDPQDVYDGAYSDFLSGNYDLAILGFRQYLDGEPAGDLADNALYWIGECYYRQSKFQQAIRLFDQVIDGFQTSDRIPSAMLKKGYAYLELGQRAQGILQLQDVQRAFPGTDESQLAGQRLQDLGIDADP